MIEIDVIGQLLPNPITMLTQLCSTLVLFLVIKKFLWKSITGMLDRRAEKMQEELTASEQARQQAQQDRENARQELKEAVTRSQTMIEKATVEAKSVREEIVRKAKTEADDQIIRARGQIELERSQMQSEIHREMVEVAMSAAEKLIGEKSIEAGDRQAVDQFVKEVSAYGQGKRRTGPLGTTGPLLSGRRGRKSAAAGFFQRGEDQRGRKKTDGEHPVCRADRRHVHLFPRFADRQETNEACR